VANNRNLRDVFWDVIYEEASRNSDVLIVSADLGAMALDQYRQNIPKQFISVGIAEQNAVTVAAGLALEGKKVYVYANAPFIHMRCYEQIRLMLSGAKLPITIVGQGAGFSFWPYGPTHHVLEDFASLRVLPRLQIYALSDPVTARVIAKHSLRSGKPEYIRVDRLAPPALYAAEEDLSVDQGFYASGTAPLLLFGIGNTVHFVKQAAEMLNREGIACAWIDLFSLRPDGEQLAQALKRAQSVITVEEHALIGGMGAMLCEFMMDRGLYRPIKRLACDTGAGYLYEYGGREYLEAKYGLSVEDIIREGRLLAKK
jgi:transketolase